MNPKIRRRLNIFGLQMAIYGVLVSIYLYLVCRYLGDWLVMLYHENITLYAIICLVFIIVQAVFLDSVTTFIMNRLGLTKRN